MKQNTVVIGLTGARPEPENPQWGNHCCAGVRPGWMQI